MIVPDAFSAHQKAISSPNSHTVPLLLSEINSVAIRLRQRGRSTASGLAELPGAEHAVLEIIDRRGALTVPEIARERSTSRQNIQTLVDRLAACGRIELSSNPAHKRSVLVSLTQAGKELLDAGVSNQLELLTQLGSSLSESEIGATVTVLRRLSNLLSGDSEDGRERTRSLKTDVGLELGKERVADAQTLPEEFPVNLL